MGLITCTNLLITNKYVIIVMPCDETHGACFSYSMRVMFFGCLSALSAIEVFMCRRFL